MSFYDQHPTLLHYGQGSFRCSNDHDFDGVEDVEYCDECEVLCVSGGCHSVLYVHSDGACTQNGRYNAQSSIGVWFGPNSRYNLSERLHAETHHTSQRAELHAAVSAIERAIMIVKNANGDGDGLYRNNFWKNRGRQICLLTDSLYVANGFNSWMDRWEQNGWLNSQGHPVANMDLFETLSDLKSEQCRGYGLHVQWIPREDNYVADALAKRALGRC